MNSNIDFYYFSGTGNTMLVTRKMADVFTRGGYHVKMERMEYSKGSDVNVDCTIGLGFPVAILSTYNLVWNFIKSLPDVQGTEIFMVDTMGGYSGGLVGPLRAVLEKKGYKTIGACEIVMPLNIFYIQEEKTNRQKVKRGLEVAEKYANALMNGKAHWGRVPVFSDAINLISIAGLKLTAAGLHQRYFKFSTKKSKCNQCRLCVDICPVGNITMEAYPVTGNKCEYCMRCVSMCPRGAIKAAFNYKGKIYRAVKAKNFL